MDATTRYYEELIKRHGWDYIVSLMDDEIREMVHAEFSPCTNAEFLEAYDGYHAAKYGEELRIP